MRPTPCITVALALLAASTLSGCNTVRGVGKDIHDSAQSVQVVLEGNEKNARQLDNGYGYDRPRPDARVQR